MKPERSYMKTKLNTVLCSLIDLKDYEKDHPTLETDKIEEKYIKALEDFLQEFSE